MKVLCRFLLPALALAITVPARAFDCEGVTPVTGENVTVETDTILVRDPFAG